MSGRFCVQATWDDVPHLSDEKKKELWESCSPHEREARAKGVPSLGAGKVYPVSEELILIDDIKIPEHWPKAYGMDVGWNRTAAIWGAWDRHSDIIYLYNEHYMAQSEPAVHSQAIKARGDWIMGAIDPASNGANQKDGSRLLDEYRGLGLNLVKADNAVEAGILACYRRMSEGRLKVFRSCQNWTTESRIYSRDENGKIVKKNDHLMDAMRYLIMTFARVATIEPQEIEENMHRRESSGRSSTTGY